MKDRPTVKYLKALTHTDGWFLTTYFAHKPKCVAIDTEYIGKRVLAMLRRRYCVWENDGYYYVTNKGKEYE